MKNRKSVAFVLIGGGLLMLCLLWVLGVTAIAQERTSNNLDASGPALALVDAPSVEADIEPSLAVTITIYLPMVGKMPSTTTSNATLARPPAGGSLGLLGGLLATGLLVGLFVLTSNERSDDEDV